MHGFPTQENSLGKQKHNFIWLVLPPSWLSSLSAANNPSSMGIGKVNNRKKDLRRFVSYGAIDISLLNTSVRHERIGDDTVCAPCCRITALAESRYVSVEARS